MRRTCVVTLGSAPRLDCIVVINVPLSAENKPAYRIRFNNNANDIRCVHLCYSRRSAKYPARRCTCEENPREIPRLRSCSTSKTGLVSLDLSDQRLLTAAVFVESVVIAQRKMRCKIGSWLSASLKRSDGLSYLHGRLTTTRRLEDTVSDPVRRNLKNRFVIFRWRCLVFVVNSRNACHANDSMMTR